jgi:hypothetical protein
MSTCWKLMVSCNVWKMSNKSLCISAMNKMFDDPRASYSRPVYDQKHPFFFQQLMDMHASCHLSQWVHHLDVPAQGSHPGGKESMMIALRFLVITHFHT